LVLWRTVFGWGRGGGLFGDVAGAGAGEFVGIDEESSVGVTGVHGESTVVDILLSALGLVTGGQQTAGAFGEEAGFEAGGLGVVVVAVSISFGDVLKDDSPEALHVDGTLDTGVKDFGGAKVALWANPVGGVEWGGSFGGSGVVGVVEFGFDRSGDGGDKVVGGLISHVGVLLEEQGVLGDFVGNVVGGVFGVFEAIGKVGASCACRGGFRVAVGGGGGSVAVGGGGVVRGGVVRVGGPGD